MSEHRWKWVADLPDGERVVGMVNYHGKVYVACESGHIYGMTGLDSREPLTIQRIDPIEYSGLWRAFDEMVQRELRTIQAMGPSGFMGRNQHETSTD